MTKFQKFVWVFRPDIVTDLKRKVEAFLKAGYAFAVKTHDGNPDDDGTYFWNNYHLIDSIVGYRAPVYAWGYNYGNKFGTLNKEIEGAVKSVRTADGYIFDPEIEFEVKDAGAWVEKMVQAVLDASAGKPVGYAPFWNRRYHGGYPYAVFDKFGITAMPQVYYDLAQRTTVTSRNEMFKIAYEDFPGNFMPVSGTSSVEGLMHFLKCCTDYNVNHSIWLLDGTTEEQLNYLELVNSVQGLDEALDSATQIYNALQLIKRLLG